MKKVILFFLLSALFAGCKKSPITDNEGSSSSVDKLTSAKPSKEKFVVQRISSGTQSGNTGEYLRESLRVRVIDNKGKGVRGIPVNFAVTSGGGSTDNGLVNTNAEGYAQTNWRAGLVEGTQTAEATAKDRIGDIILGSPVLFSATVSTLFQIGNTYGGGIIFYIDATGQHGLVCSTTDQGSAPWDLTLFDPNNYQLYNPPLVGSSGTGTGTGSSNTTAIINTIGGGNYAASLCRSYNGGGYTDWSLPSKDELNIIYQNLKVPGLAVFSNTLTYYWSSSEIDYRAAWSQKFDDGTQVDFAWKNNVMNTRAVRSF